MIALKLTLIPSRSEVHLLDKLCVRVPNASCGCITPILESVSFSLDQLKMFIAICENIRDSVPSGEPKTILSSTIAVIVARVPANNS